jgi:GDP-L-fucose synthase
MKILLTGGAGMLGRAILRLAHTIQPDFQMIAPLRSELNLLDRAAVQRYFQQNKCDAIIHCAAKVGGIKANIDDPIGFMTENILISTHLIEEARLHHISRLINIGSSCMYPRDYQGILSEDAILTAPLEPTNEAYAIAKIAAAKLCQYISDKHGFAYRTFIPCNLYGQDDNFDTNTGHMIAAAIAKIHAAHQNGDIDVEIWGNGTVRREFLYADDLATFILNSIPRLELCPQNLNCGLGFDLSVNEFYQIIANVIGFKGRFIHNLDKPVGMKNKLMNIDKAKSFGWHPSTDLYQGIENTYSSYLRIFAN